MSLFEKSSDKGIGGFVDFSGSSPSFLNFKEGLFFNSGRNALLFLLKNTLKGQAIQVPNYTCPAVWETIKKANIEPVGYEINSNFEPLNFSPELPMIVNNYFGLKDRFIEKFVKNNSNIIIDNAQAFFSPSYGVPAVYSPRKFLPLPDGGILLSSFHLEDKYSTLPCTSSIKNLNHLFLKAERKDQEGYKLFLENEKRIEVLEEGKISKIALMRIFDYKVVKESLRNNFNYLHKYLKNTNDLSIEAIGGSGSLVSIPLAYPFLCCKPGLREKLLKERIYVPRYWPMVPEVECMKSELSKYLAEYLFPLPIDSRYSIKEMEKILKVIYE